MQKQHGEESWERFCLLALFEQGKKLAEHLAISMQDLLGIFQLANSGKDIWMAYKSVKSLPVSSQVPRYDSPVRPTDRSIEMYQRPGIFTPSTECPREPEVFRRCTAIPSSIIADKHITLQNIGDILCRLINPRGYLPAEDDAVPILKLLTLSAGLQDRVTKPSLDCDRLQLRIQGEIDHRSAQPSDHEKTCMRHLVKEREEYRHNSTVYSNAFVNGTPDAIVLGNGGSVTRCAEFKTTSSISERSVKSQGTSQLMFYLYIFGLDCGDLVILNLQTNECKTYLVTMDLKIVTEKIGYFLSFKKHLLKKEDDFAQKYEKILLLELKPSSKRSKMSSPVSKDHSAEFSIKKIKQ